MEETLPPNIYTHEIILQPYRILEFKGANTEYIVSLGRREIGLPPGRRKPTEEEAGEETTNCWFPAARLFTPPQSSSKSPFLSVSSPVLLLYVLPLPLCFSVTQKVC